MPEDNTNTPATLTILPAAPKRKANKTDIIMMIAELEYERRRKEADRLLAKRNELVVELDAEAKALMAERLKTLTPDDFIIYMGGYSSYDTDTRFSITIGDTPRMTKLRKAIWEIVIPVVSKSDILRAVRLKMEAHRTSHIKLVLAEDPTLRQGVEELRKQLFND